MKVKRRWWTLYRDRRGKYRAKARSSNGRAVWSSSQGYKSRADAVANAQLDGGAPLELREAKLGEENRFVS